MLAQPVREASQNTLMGHEQGRGAAREVLGYRAHVIYHKVYMLTFGTLRYIERTQHPKQLNGMPPTDPLRAPTDDRALLAPYTNQKNIRAEGQAVASVYTRIAGPSVRFAPTPDPRGNGLQKAPTHGKSNTMCRGGSQAKPCACPHEEAPGQEDWAC